MPHINEKIDFTVEVFIVHKNKVLLRKHDKHGIWLSVGGHIELHEDPNQAAVREAKEETGLSVKLYDALRPFKTDTDDYQELIPPTFLNRHRINDSHEHISLVYFASADSDKVVDEGREQSDGIMWLSQQELEDHAEIDPRVMAYALRALRELA